MINVVKYKTNTGYNNAIKAGNTSSSTILQTHEPFRIIVFDDAKPVRRDARVVSRITEIEDINQIPTGNALLLINAYNEFKEYDAGLAEEAKKLIAKNNIKIIEEVQFALGYIVEVPETLTFSRFLNALNKTYEGESLFSIIEEDVIVEAQSCDYYAWPYNSQWHLNDIDALNAYDLLDNGNYNSEAGVTYGEWHTRDVAILDGHGFEFTHPDLDNDEYPENHPGRYMTRKNWDCVLNNNNPQPAGLNDKHGTVMAGIAASGWADRRFLRGVGLDHINAQCLRIGYNVSQTGTFSTSTSIIIRGLNKAALNANCASIVMPFSQLYYSPFTNIYLENIKAFGRFGKGMSIFAASGNSGLNSISAVYPASYNAVMAIGASTPTNLKASFSNYGEGLFATAPGVSIFAIDRCCGRGYNINPDSTYGSVTYFSGTSAASVIAASIAATMVVANPNITALEIKTILEITARRLGPYDYESTSNEIGFFTGISSEMGNGILTQAESIQKAIEYAEVNQSTFVNYSMDTLGPIQWRYCNACPSFTTQPIPAGVYFKSDFSATFTNTGSEPIPIDVSNVRVAASIALEENGPEPTESTPMLPLSTSHTFFDGDFVLLAGESVTKLGRWSVSDPGNISCIFDGTYYISVKIDPSDYVAETSEEDNILHQQIEFAYDPYYTNKYCGSPGNTLPQNPNLRIDRLTASISNEPLPGQLIGNYWTVRARYTNLGDQPIYNAYARFGWNPTIIGAIQNSSGISINFTSSPLLPGQSAYYQKNIPYPPLLYPIILTGNIQTVNGWPLSPILPIHVAQSNIIYG